MIDAIDTVRAEPSSPGWLLSDKLAGLLTVTLFPALFWTLMIAGAGKALGVSLTMPVLLTAGLAIAVFLGAVFDALVHQQGSEMQG